MPTLKMYRGLPGVGKSTKAAQENKQVHAADDHMVNEAGEYTFDPSRLGEVHAACLAAVKADLAKHGSAATANTFSCRWEMEPYLAHAREEGVNVQVIDLFDGGLTDEELAARCVHGAPVEGIAAMRTRWEHDWEAGDVRPPWERNRSWMSEIT
jgi:hypothetical protein